MNIKNKIEKNMVSESNLLKLFIYEPQFDVRHMPCFKTYFLSDIELEKLLLSWKKNIVRDSTLLSRQSLSTLTDLPQDALYCNLDQEDWRIAAQVAEVFRNPLICKNAGRLNLKALQINILEWFVNSQQPLNLSIAWGQPKRSVGGIKCMGSYADLAELFSISRLLTIVCAIEKILKRPIKLMVLTGGHRFYSALFTCLELTFNYDLQRQAIADYMDDQKRIEFKSFIHHEDVLNYAIDDKQLKKISDQQIQSQFRTIMLNIDWEHLLHPKSSLRLHNPHHIELSDCLANWLTLQSLETVNAFIRQAIYYLLRQEHNNQSNLKHNQEHMLLENMIAFIYEVTWESTRKYIAIHDLSATKQQENLNHPYFRLTVHEKDDQRTLPAIFTLGVNGGNQLAQHVMAFLENRQLHFGAFAEFWDRDLVLIKLNINSKYPLFEWLKEYEQPLCISDTASNILFPSLSMSSRLIN